MIRERQFAPFNSRLVLGTFTLSLSSVSTCGQVSQVLQINLLGTGIKWAALKSSKTVGSKPSITNPVSVRKWKFSHMYPDKTFELWWFLESKPISLVILTWEKMVSGSLRNR